ncbi:hypothetical protein [Pandoraea terrigena]|uniref:Uncharacterized protein n=1 Tax=Pandoraea terrigena TaxID=2508292 RepID=A0A5E4YXT4_9BURK|nr:hypothetical protein [Pandoraea terrigena]VVE52713.1 hypothetical protein PTE31013_04835 [Pandoraea terrigena]
MNGINSTPDGLSDDDANECIDHIEGISGVQLTRDQLHDVLDRRLIAEVSEWGVEDTEVGGRIANAISLHLLGQSWPLIGDGIDMDSHVSALQAAARERGYEVSDLVDENATLRRSEAPSRPDAHQVVHTVVVGEERPSMLERLTPQEREALFSWSRKQNPSSPGGAIDLMTWPGWTGALHRVQADSTAAWGTALDVIDRIKSSSAK